MMKRYYLKQIQGEKNALLDLITKELNIDKNKALELIKQGSVWDDSLKKRIKNPDFIVESQLIIVFVPEFPIIEFILNKNDIIYEDDFFIVAYKKKGVNSTPTPFSDIDCMIYGVQKYYNENKIDHIVSPLNRLDCPTDGLLIYAKDKETEKYFHRLFRERKIKKLYFAKTVAFKNLKNVALIRDNLTWKNKSSEAISYIKFIKQHNGEFYFCIYPATGRTHQIRKHFQKYLSPIIGDSLYGNYSRNDELQLTCYYYRFIHPYTGNNFEINIYDRIAM